MRTRTFMGLAVGLIFVVSLAERAEAHPPGRGFNVVFSFGGGGHFPGGGYDPLTQQFQRVPSYGYGGGYGGGLYVDPRTGNYLAPSNFYGGGYRVYGIPTQRVYIQDGGYGGYQYYEGHHHRHH